jgi:Domain of unknown function (DUF4838)/Glycosyl hydrolase family 67 N-terminus
MLAAVVAGHAKNATKSANEHLMTLLSIVRLDRSRGELLVRHGCVPDDVRRALFGWISLSLVAACGGARLSAAEPAKATLANRGESAWTIHSASSQAVPAQFAVVELQSYFAQISGAKLPLAKRRGAAPEIVVGLRKDLTDDDRARLPPKKEGADGYAIVVSAQPARVVIAGDNQRGVVYGVYDFLEHLGCRWFYPTQDPRDSEVVPRLSTVALAPAAWAVASPIARRISNDDGWMFQIDCAVAKKQVDWAMKNRYNAMGWAGAPANGGKSLAEQYRALQDAGVLAEVEKRGMSLHGPGHSFDHFLNSSVYFGKHPEWFGMRGGKRVGQDALGAQFCWSNAAARKEFVKNAEAFIVAAPLIHVFCTIPFDGGPACECAECKKLGASNLATTLMGELLERLKSSRPDVVVEQVAGYPPLTEPPSDPKRVPPGLRFAWAQWGRSHAMGYDDPRYDATNLEQWRKAAAGKLTICQYYGDNFSQPWIMGPFTTAIDGDRRYFVKHRIDAVYVLMYPTGYWWNHRLNCYLAGRCLYDVSLDPLAEVRDYALHYFGPQAGPLLAEYYTQWARNIELSYRLRGDARKHDRAMLADQRKKLIDPALEASKGDALFAHRVGKVETLHALAEQLADVSRRRQEILLRRRKGDFAAAADSLQQTRRAVDETMARFYVAADLKEGLVDRNENTAFIKLTLQSWLDEEAQAIAAKDRTVPPHMEPALKEADEPPADARP